MNTPQEYHKFLAKKMSDVTLKEVYRLMVKSLCQEELSTDDWCIAVVNEWHFRLDPKH